MTSSMRIYLKNIPARFHPDLIWNDAVLGVFWRWSPQEKEEEEEEEQQQQQQQDELAI